MSVNQTTSFCYCWAITRLDGTKFGFTDHDKKLSFDDFDFVPVDGVLTTQISTSLDLEVDDVDIEGVLDDDDLTEDDLRAGLFDNATVTIYIADWQDVTDRRILVTGNLGNVITSDYGFSADFKSLSDKLARITGLVYQRTCDADLGDTRCGVDVTDPIYRINATVTSAGELSVELDDLSAYDNGWFVLGELVAADGSKYGIRAHTNNRLELWEVPFPALSVNDVVRVTAGCKKGQTACADKFQNIINFRGYALFMPGQDALTDYPVRGETDYNGGSLFSTTNS